MAFLLLFFHFQNIIWRTSKIITHSRKNNQINSANFIFAIYEPTDSTGHNKGFTFNNPKYKEAFKTADLYAYYVIEAIKARPAYEKEDWLIIITSDHGGINTSHGGRSLMEMDTPFVIAGKNVKKGGEFSEAMMQYDTAATIAEAFGLKTPQLWRGQSMSQVFE